MSTQGKGSEIKPVPIPDPRRLDVPSVISAFINQMTYGVVIDEHTATLDDIYRAISQTVRGLLAERWFRTQEAYYWLDLKRVYYLSLEFLIGRVLLNNLLNLGTTDVYTQALEALGYRLEDLEEREPDAGLGNGGLGRLAACFLESAATLGIPFYGYGIRYEYGIFRQEIVGGAQMEAPDNWLRYWNPWEVPRPNVVVPVRFYGRVDFHRYADGSYSASWVDTETLHATAYDMMVAGYRNDVVNTLRLWAAKATEEFDLARFNAGEYVRAVEHKTESENISKVLYPPDDQSAGKELRLKQQYFFVSATLQDVIRRFRKFHTSWDELPDKAAVQLNDTHPAIAVPEIMRLLVDEHRLEWDHAWRLTERLFSFTNHTVLPEALETWPVSTMASLLPRHMQIIEEIDQRLRRRRRPAAEPDEALRRAEIVDHDGGVVRMANLAIAGSHVVNGVAALHSTILRETVFPELHAMFPGRFSNVTNGISQRRWLLHANKPLAELITEAIGEEWVTDLDQLLKLEAFADDAAFRERWRAVKVLNKERLADWTDRTFGLDFDPGSLLDCHIKRIHEYKRQLLTLMHALALYQRMRGADESPVRRTVLFAGKAAPSYWVAKSVISLAHAVAQMIERDRYARHRLKVVFVPNYGVSQAEKIFPATELSEQVSTAGSEASGTGNMKATLNGALIIGTADGANIEICERIGAENMFRFGHSAAAIAELRRGGIDATATVAADPELSGVLEIIESLSRQHGGTFDPIIQILTRHDFYCHAADFHSYAEAQRQAALVYANIDEWTTRSIRSVARIGYFSSDRAVAEYARNIWNAQPLAAAMAAFAKPGG